MREEKTDLSSGRTPTTSLYISSFYYEHFLCQNSTIENVEKLLRSSNPQKALGPDMIPARLLKECSKELAPILATIFNKSLQTGTVPADWTRANVSAVFKKGQCYDPINYRPVSLTCLCCKFLEHVILSNVMKHVDQHKILTNCHHGFRRRRS